MIWGWTKSFGEWAIWKSFRSYSYGSSTLLYIPLSYPWVNLNFVQFFCAALFGVCTMGLVLKSFGKRWGIRYNQMYTFFFRELISSLWKFLRITLFSQGNRVKDQLNLEQPGLSSMHHRPESRLAQSRAHASAST